MDPATKVRIAEIASQDDAALAYMMKFMKEIRDVEYKKGEGIPEVRNNQLKGSIPSEAQDGVKIEVFEKGKKDYYEYLGYTMMGDYKGSDFMDTDPTNGEAQYAYFYTDLGTQTRFTQGAMQTIQRTVNGVDPKTGRSQGTGWSAGYNRDRQTVEYITDQIRSGANINSTEHFVPIIGKTGKIVAYERPMDPTMLAKVKRNNDLPEMLGAWRGRQVEEDIAAEYNGALVKAVWDVWDQAEPNRKKEFINLATSKDPVHKDAWNLIPRETKDQIRAKFGKDTFMVRVDMINNTVGSRDASIGDAWTGMSRMNPKLQNALVKSTTRMFGKNAYKYLMTGEKGLQTLVSGAKNTIVIRSVIVPVANMLANQGQLWMRGVPIRDIISQQPKILAEIDQHLKYLQRKIELEIELSTVQDKPTEVTKIKAKLQGIEDAQKRMSIYPLIQAGEFSTINEGLTDLDAAIAGGKYVDWIEEKVDKLPGKLKTVGKYAIVSRDTALYNAMSRAVQYGDFLGKAVYYNHLVNNKGVKPQEALNKITEEFVNFNLNPGRSRTYLESMGLTWFWNFKLRIMKTAISMVRDNPLRVLMAGMGIGITGDLGIGSPITDNIISVWADDRLGHSIGLGMLYDSVWLNPWLNLFGISG